MQCGLHSSLQRAEVLWFSVSMLYFQLRMKCYEDLLSRSIVYPIKFLLYFLYADRHSLHVVVGKINQTSWRSWTPRPFESRRRNQTDLIVWGSSSQGIWNEVLSLLLFFQVCEQYKSLSYYFLNTNMNFSLVVSFRQCKMRQKYKRRSLRSGQLKIFKRNCLGYVMRLTVCWSPIFKRYRSISCE